MIVLFLAACADIPGPVTTEAVPPDSPFTIKPSSPHVGTQSPEYPADVLAPGIRILTPADGAVFDNTSQTLLRWTAADGGPVVACSVQIGLNAPVFLAPTTDWSDVVFPVVLPYGTTVLTVRAFGPSGDSAVATVTVERPAPPNLPSPSVFLTSPSDGTITDDCLVNVVGGVTSAAMASRVEVDLPDVSGFTAIIPPTADGFVHFETTLALQPSKNNRIRASVFDLDGDLVNTTTISVFCAEPSDTVPPSVSFVDSFEDSTVETPFIDVVGLATDDQAIGAVLVRVGDGPFVPTILATDGNPTSTTFTGTVALEPGDNTIVALAFDTVGNTATAHTVVHYVPDPAYSVPITHTLSIHEPEFPTVSMTLDRSFLQKAFPGDTGADITLLTLDPLPMLQGALQWIIDQCFDNGGVITCPPNWTAAEVNMWKLLTMTAASANVSGTDFENLQEVADVLSSYVHKGTNEPLLQDFATLLAMTLGVDLDETIISTDAVAKAIVSTLLASHPGTVDGAIPVTLQDGLLDMATLGKRFGAQGEHPGFIPKDATPYSKVMLDDFALTLTGTSNLVYKDGIVLSDGAKGQMVLLADGYEDVLQLDFLNEETFSINGLAENPTVDLPFFMIEHTGPLEPSSSPIGDPHDTSGNFTVAGPWTLEHVIAEAAYLVFRDYVAGCDLCTEQSGQQSLLWEIPGIEKGENDLAEIVVGTAGISVNGTVSKHFPLINPNPPAWMRVWVGGGYGLPEDIQAQKLDLWNVGYLWDILVSVAEQRLHDDVASGTTVEVHFTLQDVPVGLSGEELVDAVKEGMELQKSEITSLMLGNYGANSDPVDIFLTQAEDSTLALVQVTDGDPLPSAMTAALPYLTPGFFEDDALLFPVADVWVDGRPALWLNNTTVRTAYAVDITGCVVRIEASAISDTQATVTTRREVSCTP